MKVLWRSLCPTLCALSLCFCLTDGAFAQGWRRIAKPQAPEGFSPVPGTKAEPYTKTAWAKEIIHEKTGIELAFVPAGLFTMGSPGRLPEDDEGAAHRLRMTRPFYMGKCEVTQEVWQRIMGSNPSRFKGDRNPVDRVSWNDCQAFLKKVGDGLRLPTEAEWEHACRAGSTKRYCFGDNERDLDKYAWFEGNSGKKSHPVGTKRPNRWGLYDMHGNMWEWCSSLRTPYPYKEDDGREDLDAEGRRVLRGGAWYHYPRFERSAVRRGEGPEWKYYVTGFRVALTVEEGEGPSVVALATRTPARQSTDPNQKECRMVHLWYPAPDGVAFYNEVTVKRSAAGAYFMACGFNGGYFGIQQLNRGKKVVLFSVWDTSRGDDPNAVASDKRVGLVRQGQGVRIGRFGGEGTGGQCFFDYQWRLGDTYRFLVTARANGNRSEFSGFFYLPREKQWKHLVTFSKVTGGKYLNGYYSFVEDFKRNTYSAKRAREALFGNGWVLSCNGGWGALTQAKFTAKDTRGTNINAAEEDGRFLLATGGTTKNTGAKLREVIQLPKAKNRTPPEGLPAP